MPIDEVNERTTWITSHAFTDEDGAAVLPGAASYRIDDVGSDLEIRGDTEMVLGSPLPASTEIEWTPDDTSILDETHAYETRRMTVSWEYGAGRGGHAEYLLNVRNLKGVVTPSPP